MHTCPRVGCQARVPDEMFACRPHWFSLPKHLRDAIWNAYHRNGVGSSELTTAHLAALEHWEQA